MHDPTIHGVAGIVQPPGNHALTQFGGTTGIAVAAIIGVPFAVYVAVVMTIAWRAHRDQAGFDNNLRLLRLLLGVLPWRH
ncbi:MULTISPECIES: hypothetical protein [Thermomonosporaceae]|uniref:hypothetical protein n=1 Tax=Thermomonosporaceae TaxID=2012 RepID=UPI00255ABE1E|nr:MULTISPECIES: hypothetical protein [Thermomonosporaceae]MDL4771802.1 hypothetical protein [Actinomadura xylanilytica]